jgi:hypothetical protein
MSVTAAHYLRDLALLLKEQALAARREAKSAEGTTEHGFALGRSHAYYEVLSLMRDQALAFALPLDAVSLADIEPDRDLV